MRGAFSAVVGVIELTVVEVGHGALPSGIDDQNLAQTLVRLVSDCTDDRGSLSSVQPAVRRWTLNRCSIPHPLSAPVEIVLAHRGRLEEELAVETEALLVRLGMRS